MLLKYTRMGYVDRWGRGRPFSATRFFSGADQAASLPLAALIPMLIFSHAINAMPYYERYQLKIPRLALASRRCCF